jgi:O-antigen ligase
MTHASVIWEFSKYATLLVVVLTLCLRRPRITSHLPAFYLALLVPGAVLTLLSISDLNELRQTLSFNLSGPLAYAVCSLFLLGRQMSREDVLLGLTAMLAPIVGVAAITLFSIETTEITFGASSSKVTSGGFGPNEVSAALGLGVVMCFLILTSKDGGRVWKGFLIGLIIWFAIQSALTFSRSGLYYAAAAMLAGTVFMVSDLRRLVVVLVLALPLLGLGWFVVVPMLDAYTGGALIKRFGNTSLTGRNLLMENDLDLFLDHPALGVGVGLGDASRSNARGALDVVHSHTEFTRLLSEHGLLGAAAIALMLVISTRPLIFQTPGWPKTFSVSLVVFALVFMTGSGMRLAIPSFLLAFAGVRIVQPQSKALKPQKQMQCLIVKAMPRTRSPVHPPRPWQPVK